MKKILLLGFLGFIVAPPVANNVCNRPLNVLTLGYYGASKSTIINMLNNFCDLDSVVKEASTSLSSAVTLTTMYPCSYGGRSLNVVDTPGFETVKSSNFEIRKRIVAEVSDTFRDGIDAFILVVPLGRTPEHSIVDMIDFLNSLITKDGFSRGFVVFTNADGMLMNAIDEIAQVLRFRDEIGALAPRAERFLNSVKYLFFRHDFEETGVTKLDTNGVKKQFLDRVYTEIFKLCESNNGSTFSTNEMKKAKDKYESQKREIEEYRSIRKELEKSISTIINQNENVSSDLFDKIKKMREIAPSLTFQNPKDQTQDEILIAEKNYHELTKNLRDSIHTHSFLQNQLKMMSNNVTTLMEEYSIARQEYNIEKELFVSETKKIEAVQFRIPCYENQYLAWYYRQAQEIIQRELDSVPMYYIDKYMSKAAFDNDHFVTPKLYSVNPTFNDFLEQIQVLKEQTAIINNRVSEIRRLKEEMRNAVYRIKDYEHGEKIFIQYASNFNEKIRQDIMNCKVV
ncbi:hypothetical protein ROZALSC1DRAFT_30210, partial [Rozella allomycis CSF55]